MLKLHSLVRDEAEYKMGILLDDDELRESCEISTSQVQQIIECCRRDGDFSVLTLRQREVLADELINTADIATDNAFYENKHGDLEACNGLKQWARKLNVAAKSLES